MAPSPHTFEVTSYVDSTLRTRVSSALRAVARVLEHERNTLALADAVEHRYVDKYTLVEALTAQCTRALFSALARLGLTVASWRDMHRWAHAERRAVTLRLAVTERCTFVRKVVREVRSDTTRVGESTLFGTSKSYTITKVTEYFWRFECAYRLYAFGGTDDAPDAGRTLAARTGACTLMTTADSSPHVEVRVRDPVDVDLSWLLSVLDDDGEAPRATFAIDRARDDCFTPRRNRELDAALRALDALSSFAARVNAYFVSTLFPIAETAEHWHRDTRRALDGIDALFVPVLPLFDRVANRGGGDGDDGGDTNGRVPLDLIDSLLAEHTRTLDEVFAAVDQEFSALAVDEHPHALRRHTHPDPGFVCDMCSVTFEKGDDRHRTSRRCHECDYDLCPACAQHKTKPRKVAATDDAGLFSANEARVAVVMCHIARQLIAAHAHGVQFVEEMLRAQLVAAIGKHVQPSDFDAYMLYHARQLFVDACAPRPFAHALRVDEHCPQGMLSLDSSAAAPGELAQPLRTMSRAMGVRHNGAPTHTMRFPISASAEVRFRGERFVHGVVLNKFADSPSAPDLRLVARARQFSSFVLLVGRIGGVDAFDVKHAFVVRNRDELTLPLRLETIPTAAEFKRATVSLSPEQQRFASAFRSMQLESTLFAVAVVHLRPHVERLLRLEPDALDKDIELFEHVLDLFIKYQVSPDLLAFDGPPACSRDYKLRRLRRSVANMRAVIDEMKRGQLDDAREKQQMRVAENDELLDMLDELEGAPEAKSHHHHRRGGQSAGRVMSKNSPRGSAKSADSSAVVRKPPRRPGKSAAPVSTRSPSSPSRSSSSPPQSSTSSTSSSLSSSSSSSTSLLSSGGERQGVRAQIADTKEVMCSNLDAVLERGDKIEDLLDRSELLQANSSVFAKQAQQLNASPVSRLASAASSAMSGLFDNFSRREEEPAMSIASGAVCAGDVAGYDDALCVPCEIECPLDDSEDLVRALAESAAAAEAERQRRADEAAARALAEAERQRAADEAEEARARALPEPRYWWHDEAGDGGEGAVVDYTRVPTELDAAVERYGESDSMRPTIIHLHDDRMQRARFRSLLADAPERTTLSVDAQRTERQQAFDLLDCVTRSGALALDRYVQLHVVCMMSQCFDETLMNTLVRENRNPIEVVERGALIVSAVVDKCAQQALGGDATTTTAKTTTAKTKTAKTKTTGASSSSSSSLSSSLDFLSSVRAEQHERVLAYSPKLNVGGDGGGGTSGGTAGSGGDDDDEEGTA